MARQATGSIVKTAAGKWRVQLAGHVVGTFDKQREASYIRAIAADIYSTYERHITVYMPGVRPRRVFTDPENSDESVVKRGESKQKY